ncbi:MAG: DNA polymerase III subunit gamma/tau, partial [bacterium]
MLDRTSGKKNRSARKSKEAAPKSASGSAGADDPAYEVLARRARPQTFEEVVGQEHVTRTLANAIEQGRLGHAFIFSGMRGVGKTTTARILAKALNCINGPTATPCNACESCVEITEGRSLDVFEVDAASQTGIDATRELLETVKYQPASARFRIYIIDEAHGLSRQAVDAFLKTLEEPPPHAKFILATTAPQKLTSTILSRCQRYDFRSVSVTEVIGALQGMLEKEGQKADDSALAILARESGGSLRDATSLLEQVLAFADGEIDAAMVHASLGLPDREALRQLIGALKARDAGTALGIVADIVGQGADLTRFAVELLEELRHLTVLKVASRAALSDLMETEIEALEELAADAPADDLQRWFRILLRAQEEIGRSAVPQLVLEMAVVEMATLPELVAIDALVERLEAIERLTSIHEAPRPRSRAKHTLRHQIVVRVALTAVAVSALGCSTFSSKQIEARYSPSEGILETVAVLRRHVPDDTYRFPPANDFSGRNVYRASLLRLESLERAEASAMRSGYMDDVIAFSKARSLERLRAFEVLLDRYPEWRGKVMFAQLGATTRSHIASYRELSEEVDALVEQINAKYQTDTWKPIYRVTQPMPTSEL